jgi:hypothetical protein
MEDQPDKRLKYVDLNRVFHNRTQQIKLDLKLSNKSCEMLARHVSKMNPKTAVEQEQYDKLTQYALTTSKLNDEVLQLLDYIHGLLTDIGNDSQVLIEGAIIRDRLQMQSDNMEQVIKQRDDAMKVIYDLRKDSFNP